MAVAMVALFAGLAACVPVQYLSYVFNWKRDAEARVILFTFVATMLATASFISNLIE